MDKRARSAPRPTSKETADRLREISDALLDSVRGRGGDTITVTCDGTCGYFPNCETKKQ